MRIFGSAFLIVLGGLFAVSAQAQFMSDYGVAKKDGPVLPPADRNPFGNYGNSPHLLDAKGQFQGDLNTNRYDPLSVSNPYGRYGRRYYGRRNNAALGQFGGYADDYGSELYIAGPNSAPASPTNPP